MDSAVAAQPSQPSENGAAGFLMVGQKRRPRGRKRAAPEAEVVPGASEFAKMARIAEGQEPLERSHRQGKGANLHVVLEVSKDAMAQSPTTLSASLKATAGEVNDDMMEVEESEEPAPLDAPGAPTAAPKPAKPATGKSNTYEVIKKQLLALNEKASKDIQTVLASAFYHDGDKLICPLTSTSRPLRARASWFFLEDEWWGDPQLGMRTGACEN